MALPKVVPPKMNVPKIAPTKLLAPKIPAKLTAPKIPLPAKDVFPKVKPQVVPVVKPKLTQPKVIAPPKVKPPKVVPLPKAAPIPKIAPLKKLSPIEKIAPPKKAATTKLVPPKVTPPKFPKVKALPLKKPPKASAPKKPSGFGKMVDGKIGKVLSKESGGKLGAGVVGLEDRKYFKDVGIKKAAKFARGDEKTRQELEKRMETVILKKVMDGKIKTPIPAPILKTMVRVEDWWQKKELQNQKLMHKINQKLPKFLLGKDREQVLETDRELIAKQEAKIREKEQIKKDIRELDAKFGGKPKKPMAKPKAAPIKKPLVPSKKPALKAPKPTKKVPAKIPTKLVPTKLTKAVPKKGLGKLQLYMKAKPVFENMGVVVSPKTLTRKPGKFSLGKAVKKNAKYNAKMLPKEAKKLTGQKLGSKKQLGKLTKVPGFKKVQKIKVPAKQTKVPKLSKMPKVQNFKGIKKIKLPAKKGGKAKLQGFKGFKGLKGMKLQTIKSPKDIGNIKRKLGKKNKGGVAELE